MVPLSLIATVRRHKTWLSSAREQLSQFSREARSCNGNPLVVSQVDVRTAQGMRTGG
jgi:hypothetical protein